MPEVQLHLYRVDHVHSILAAMHCERQTPQMHPPLQDSVKNYVFVGSAGAYDANSIEPLHVEGDKRKAKAGHVQVEKYLESESVPFTVFQPQYIYGPYTAKVFLWPHEIINSSCHAKP